MLDDLVQTIDTLKTRIKEHGAHIGAYESRTRVTLIDPMLCALGWDVSDPSAVQIEPLVKNKWADYALLGSNGKPVVFVEAKRLVDTDAPITQTVGYAVSENIENNTNVRYCASTNGDAWEVYDITAQRTVMRVRITQDDSAKCALRFLGLWRRSLQDGGFEQAVEPLVERKDVAAPTPAPHVVTSTHIPPHADGWIPLTGELNASWQNQPSRMRLPDGAEAETPSWREVIRATTRWLQVKGMLSPGTDLSASDMRTFIRSDGGTFDKPMAMSGGIVLNGNFAGASHVRHTILLLQRCGEDPSQVYLKLS